jgi:hypothetical protein
VNEVAAALLARVRSLGPGRGPLADRGRAGWGDRCRAELRHSVERGDPLEAALFAALLWYHGESTRHPDR